MFAPSLRYAFLTYRGRRSARGVRGGTPVADGGRKMAKCPECDAEVTVGADAVKGEIVACPDCGAELEVTGIGPVTLALAPEAGEDWGE